MLRNCYYKVFGSETVKWKQTKARVEGLCKKQLDLQIPNPTLPYKKEATPHFPAGKPEGLLEGKSEGGQA